MDSDIKGKMLLILIAGMIFLFIYTNPPYIYNVFGNFYIPFFY